MKAALAEIESKVNSLIKRLLKISDENSRLRLEVNQLRAENKALKSDSRKERETRDAVKKRLSRLLDQLPEE